VDSGIGVSAKRYRYTGKERDEETGLDHMGARYYAAWLGRWTSGDPIGLGDGVNRFAYVSGNPVGMRDPSGTFGTFGDRPIGEQLRQASVEAGKKADPERSPKEHPIEALKKVQLAVSQVARTRTAVSEEDLFHEQVGQEVAANETTIKKNEGFWHTGSPLLTGVGEGIAGAGVAGAAVVLAPVTTVAAGLGYFVGSGQAEETAGALGRIASGTETAADERLLGNIIGGVAAFGRIAPRAARSAGPQKALPPGRPGSVTPGGLASHEAAFAEEIVGFQGGDFVGVPKRSTPGIDGFLDGVAVSLKETTGGLAAVLRHASKAEKSAQKAGFSGVELFLKAPNVGKAQLLDFAGEGPLTAIPNQGTISSVNVFTRDGVVRVIGAP
jgi:RHS repeat-associated protein